MINKIIAIFLSFLISLFQCLIPLTANANHNNIPTSANYNFWGMDDPGLLREVESKVFEGLVKELDNDKYVILDINASYVSKEFLEAMAYNSRKNIYFGKTLAELDAQFQGKRYIFCNDEFGHTTVKQFEAYDDTYEKIATNVAIGAGVIAVCATIGVIGGPAVSVVFFAAAQGGAYGSLIGAASTGLPKLMYTYCETGDINKAIKDGALAASEGFKWGAITGAITGGTEKFLSMQKVPTYRSPIKNKVDGLRREKLEFHKLKRSYPKDSGYKIQSERYLVDKNGNIVKDPITGQARRIDFVVSKNGKVQESIEVTSKTADKTEQIAKELRIRELGGTYIKDENGALIEFPPDILTKIERYT